MRDPSRQSRLTWLRTATAFSVAVAAIKTARVRRLRRRRVGTGVEAGLRILGLSLATKAACLAQRDIVRARNSLVSPRHFEVVVAMPRRE